MRKYLVLTALFILSALVVTGCASDPRRRGDQHGFMPGSTAILGPVKQFTASYPRPKANVGPQESTNRSVTDEQLGMQAIMDKFHAHKIKEVVLDDPHVCEVLFDHGIPCTVDNGKLTPASQTMFDQFGSTNLIEIGKNTYADI